MVTDAALPKGFRPVTQAPGMAVGVPFPPSSASG